jgi:shikimate kinase
MHSKLVRAPGIYLVGFMGSGKTTVGRLLADELGWNFSDLDEEIEAEQQATIGEIFASRGEAEFRRIEHEALRKRVRSVQCGRPSVVAMGGGAFAQQSNFELVEENGITVWLDCPLDTLKRRVAGFTHRPLAAEPERFEKLYRERQPAYARADFRIEITTDDPHEAMLRILELPIF